MPLHYNLILWDSTAFVCIFSLESVFITGSFHPAPTSPTAASCRDWRDFPQARPCLYLESETAQHSNVCGPFHHLDGIQNESCCPKQGMRSFWPGLWAPCAPFSCRFLSQATYRYWFFLLTASPPDPLSSDMSAPLFHLPCYTHLYWNHTLTV